MTRLHKNLRFYSYAISLALALIVVGLIIYLMSEKHDELNKILLPAILLGGLIVFIIYLLIDLFLRVPVIYFDKESIHIGTKNLQWSDMNRIIFDVEAQYLGYPQVITSLNLSSKSIKIYNQYYKDFELLTRFIKKELSLSAAVQPTLDLPRNTNAINTEDKLYKGYRILSTHLLVSFYSLFVIIIAIKSKIDGVLDIMVTIPFLLFALMSVYLPNYIHVENGKLMVKKLFLPIIIYSIPLDELYAIRYYSTGRGPRMMMCVNKDFQSSRFYMETLPVKKFKELKVDLEAAGIVVIDDLTLQPMKMTFNTKFNLFGKKKATKVLNKGSL